MKIYEVEFATAADGPYIPYAARPYYAFYMAREAIRGRVRESTFEHPGEMTP